MIDIDQFLSMLDGVRKVGNDRWKAKCPSHEDKTPSLSIRQAEDGRILLHDFGLDCDINDICAALGLRVADLMPPRLDRPYMRPEERGTNVTGARANDFLELIDHEARVVYLIVVRLLTTGVDIRDDELMRLRRAYETISNLRDTIRPAKAPKRRSTDK